MVKIALESQQKQIARNLLAKGVDLNVIAETTDLSAEEIAVLSKTDPHS